MFFIKFWRKSKLSSDELVNVKPKIHSELCWARFKLQIRAYRKQWVRDVPTSSALAGIVFVALEQTGWEIFPRLLVSFLMLLFPPVLRLWTMPSNERAKLIRNLTKQDSETALRYLLLHLHKFMKGVCEAQRKIHRTTQQHAKYKSKRVSEWNPLNHLRTEAEYPQLLSDHLCELFGFRNSYAFLDFLQYHPERLISEIDSYKTALSEEKRLFEKDRAQMARASERAKRALAVLRNHLEKFQLVSNSETVMQGLEIIATPGTSTAVGSLVYALKHLEESGNSDRAQTLLSLVETGRGFSMTELADLKEWKDKKALLPMFSEIREQALKNLENEFDEFTKKELTNLFSVTTAGYSAAVRRCLVKARDRVKMCYLIESEAGSRGDDRKMCAELERDGIQTTLIDLRKVKSAYFRQSLNLALFGFEVMNEMGDIFHPRGVSDAFEAVAIPDVAEVSAGLKVVALGETWKVRKFQQDRPFDHALVSVYPGKHLTHVITDHSTHKPKSNSATTHKERDNDDQIYDLACCMTYWQDKVNKALLSGNSESL